MTSDPYIRQSRQWTGAGRPDCVAERVMIASKHPLIGEAGLKMIRKGGNAVDAAIAAAFMDCVVEPASNGIGGEGVMTIHLSSGENIVVDYVGRPAKSCTPTMFELEEDEEPGWMGWSNVKGNANVVGHKASSTPGTVAGLAKALELYGTLNLEDIIPPAISVAEEGFIVGWGTASAILRGMRLFSSFPGWRRLYLHDERWPFKPYSTALANPERLINKDLAESLRSIANEGPEAFYEGWIAEKIVEARARANVTGDLRVAYAFALTDEGNDLLEQMPCFCMCKNIDHMHTRDCFWTDEGKWDKHGMRCLICIEIAMNTKMMHEDGKDVCEIREKIDSHYERIAEHATETPMPEGCES